MAGKSGYQDIARRYAAAFFALAKEGRDLEQVEKDMAVLAAGIQDGAVEHFLGNATLKRADQAAAMQAIAKALKVSDLTAKLLGTLASKRRLPVLAAVIAEAQAMIAAEKGEVTADVTAAQALDQNQIDQIASQLKKSLGHDVRVVLHIDASIMGGLIIKIGSKLIDSSVRTKLERLHRALKKSTNSSDNAQMKEVA